MRQGLLLRRDSLCGPLALCDSPCDSPCEPRGPRSHCSPQRTTCHTLTHGSGPVLVERMPHGPWTAKWAAGRAEGPALDAAVAVMWMATGGAQSAGHTQSAPGRSAASMRQCLRGASLVVGFSSRPGHGRVWLPCHNPRAHATLGVVAGVAETSRSKSKLAETCCVSPRPPQIGAHHAPVAHGSRGNVAVSFCLSAAQAQVAGCWGAGGCTGWRLVVLARRGCFEQPKQGVPMHCLDTTRIPRVAKTSYHSL